MLHAIRDDFDPHYDFILLPKVPLDTLDFTSYTMNLGSKMILDATKKKKSQSRFHVSKKTEALIHQLAAHDRRIIETNLIAETLLLVKVKHDGAAVVRKLLKSAMLDGIKLVAAVSEDVDIHDPGELYLGCLHAIRLRARRQFYSAKTCRDIPYLQRNHGN